MKNNFRQLTNWMKSANCAVVFGSPIYALDLTKQLSGINKIRI